MDLFEPGSGSQVHDNNGGILASGLFWTLPVHHHELTFSRDGRFATLDVKRIEVIDSFTFGGPTGTPATTSVRVRWAATGPTAERGRGGTVPATDPAAFRGQFALARSTAAISGSEFGFSFRIATDDASEPDNRAGVHGEQMVWRFREPARKRDVSGSQPTSRAAHNGGALCDRQRSRAPAPSLLHRGRGSS